MADPSLSPSERRARVRAFKEAFPPMGVYAVRNTATGSVWVGASRNVDGALNRLQFELRMRGHRDRSLADEWAAHGAEHFRFEVVDRLRRRDDPDFDYDTELQAVLGLWQEELGARLHGSRA